MEELHLLQQQIYDYQRAISGIQVQIWQKQQQEQQDRMNKENNTKMQVESQSKNQIRNEIEEYRDQKNKATIMLGNNSDKRKLEDLYTKKVGNNEYLIVELKEQQYGFNLEYNFKEDKLINITNWNEKLIQDDQPFSNTINNYKK